MWSSLSAKFSSTLSVLSWTWSPWIILQELFFWPTSFHSAFRERNPSSGVAFREFWPFPCGRLGWNIRGRKLKGQSGLGNFGRRWITESLTWWMSTLFKKCQFPGRCYADKIFTRGSFWQVPTWEVWATNKVQKSRQSPSTSTYSKWAILFPGPFQTSQDTETRPSPGATSTTHTRTHYPQYSTRSEWAWCGWKCDRNESKPVNFGRIALWSMLTLRSICSLCWEGCFSFNRTRFSLGVQSMCLCLAGCR